MTTALIFCVTGCLSVQEEAEDKTVGKASIDGVQEFK